MERRNATASISIFILHLPVAVNSLHDAAALHLKIHDYHGSCFVEPAVFQSILHVLYE